MRRVANRRHFIVVVAGHDDDGLERVAKLNRILFFSMAVGVFLTALVSYLFAGQLLRPVAQIIREVKEISSYNLSHRIQAGTAEDEFNQLSNTFKKLFGRLEQSLVILMRF